MSSLRKVRIILSVLLLTSLLELASAQIPATDDSYTASSSPTSNFGTQPTLIVMPGVNAYIRFDLMALPATSTSSNVNKATLRLYINGVTTSGTFDVYLVIGSWTEGAITYATAPGLGTKFEQLADFDNDLETQLHRCRRDSGGASVVEFAAGLSPNPHLNFTGSSRLFAPDQRTRNSRRA